MSRTSYHLSDLKSNPELMQTLMAAAKPKEKKVKLKPTLKAKAPQEGPIVVAAPVDEPKVIVRHEDSETLHKHATVTKLVKMAEGHFNQRMPVFGSMEVLFASAYKFAEIKNRAVLARARNICKEAVANQEKREKLKTTMKSKGKPASDIKMALKLYSNKDIHLELSGIFIQVYENLKEEQEKKDGKSYDNVHTQFAMDLSEHDVSSNPVTLSRANVMVSVGHSIDLEHLKRAKKQIEVVHIEGPIYVIRNALIVGCMNYAMPKKINEDSLEVLMAEKFQVVANPLPKPLRHPSSSRTWFYVPEYSEIQVKTLAFADRSMNREFEAFRALSNNPTEDDIRFVFLQTGVEESRIDEIIKRWNASDSHQTRLAIITNEYATIVRMMKSQRLRKRREEFKASHSEMITSAEKMKDRIQQIEEEKVGLRNRFSLLASHTGNVDQGLPISKYKHVGTIFTQIERVAARGNTSSFERIKIRQGIHKDKVECRTLNHLYRNITNEAKTLHGKVKANINELERIRERVFSEGH